MSNIKALDKLRKYAEVHWEPWDASRERLNESLDEIEQEIAKRYIELPVDADGVPIRIGDVVDLDGDVFTVRVIRLDDYDWHGGWMVTGLGSQVCGDACECRHVNPRTIEDAIADALRDYAITDMSRDEVIAKYAEEIRGMMA